MNSRCSWRVCCRIWNLHFLQALQFVFDFSTSSGFHASSMLITVNKWLSFAQAEYLRKGVCDACETGHNLKTQGGARLSGSTVLWRALSLALVKQWKEPHLLVQSGHVMLNKQSLTAFPWLKQGSTLELSGGVISRTVSLLVTLLCFTHILPF